MRMMVMGMRMVMVARMNEWREWQWLWMMNWRSVVETGMMTRMLGGVRRNASHQRHLEMGLVRRARMHCRVEFRLSWTALVLNS